MIAVAELPTIVRDAARNDSRAWDQLVREFTPTIQGVARRHGLGHFDSDDVVQRTWIALMGAIDSVRDPSSLRFWLTTTARRECLRLIARAGREVPSQELVESRLPTCDNASRLLEDERRDTTRAVVAALPTPQRDLLSALSAEPALSYEEVSERVGIPVGSIGPTRQRCLQRVRKDPRIAALLDECEVPAHMARRVRPELELV